MLSSNHRDAMSNERIQQLEQRYTELNRSLESLREQVDSVVETADEINEALSKVDECLRGNLDGGNAGIVHVCANLIKAAEALSRRVDKLEDADAQSKRMAAIISAVTAVLLVIGKELMMKK